MKKLLGILVLGLLIFASPSYTADIRDFQVEGMSIGETYIAAYGTNIIKIKTNAKQGDSIMVSTLTLK